MDLFETKRSAAAALAGLGASHAAQRYDAFAETRSLPHGVRDALWHAVLLRSGACLKKDAAPVEGGMGPDTLCFCDCCVQCGSDEGDSTPSPSIPLALLAVYPSYEWVPPPPSAHACSPTEEALERAMHAYLQRLGRLPRPLPAMCQDHLQLLGAFDNITQLTGSRISRALILRELRVKAAQAVVLFLLLCGHGGRGGELILADGSAISLADVGHELESAHFRGTLVCVLNACNAESPPPTPFGSQAAELLAAAGWHPGLPFRWVLMHSSGPAEAQKPSHAAHFARLLGRLAAERPPYCDVQQRGDQLWVELRDPGQPPSLWRGPPTICMGSCAYRGCFLGPAAQDH
jgi:hypothetical protein